MKLCLNFSKSRDGIVSFKLMVFVYICFFIFFCIYLLDKVLLIIMLMNEDSVMVIVDMGLVCDIGIFRFLVNKVGNQFLVVYFGKLGVVKYSRIIQNVILLKSNDNFFNKLFFFLLEGEFICLICILFFFLCRKSIKIMVYVMLVMLN